MSADRTRPERLDILTVPDLEPVLPILYVAWSDGVLGPDEIATIRGKVERCPAVLAASRTILGRWLDPASPPTPGELLGLRRGIRDRWHANPAESDAELRSLADLGLILGGPGPRSEAAAGWDSASAADSLRAIEELLGVQGAEAVRDLVGPEPTGDPGRADEASDAPTTPPVDPAAIYRSLAGPHFDLRCEILDLIREDRYHVPFGTPKSAYRERVLSLVRELADRGYGRLGYPREFGGGGDVAGSIVAFETLAFGDLSVLVKFGVQFGLFGGSILHLGTRRHHETYLHDVGALVLPGCYAMTELGHGSNVREIETTAHHDPETGELVVHTPHAGAAKDWIGNAAAHGRLATVFAQLHVAGERHGVHAVLVPIRDDEGRVLPGIEIEDCGHKVGLNGVDNGRIRFDQVRVPGSNLLDRFASVSSEGVYESPIPSEGRRFFTMLGTLVAGRVSIAAASVSAAKRGLTIAVRYSDARRQFGPAPGTEVPVLDYLTQQRLLLPRLARTYALGFAVQELITRYAEGTDTDQRELEVQAAALKSSASWHAIGTLQACREACGGKGYASENLFGRLKDDTDVFATFEGANVVLLQLVAKGLLTRYRQEMGDLKVWGIARYIAEAAGRRVAELNPVVIRRFDEDHLLDPDLHLSAAEYREDHLLGTLARRLKARLDDGMDSFAAMNECQDHMVALGLAHADRLELVAFQRALAQAAPAVRDALTPMYRLFALTMLERNHAWYLEAGYMESVKTKAIRRLVNRLCREVRADAVAFVDAFGIPDELLGPAAFPAPSDRPHPVTGTGA